MRGRREKGRCGGEALQKQLDCVEWLYLVEPTPERQGYISDQDERVTVMTVTYTQLCPSAAHSGKILKCCKTADNQRQSVLCAAHNTLK